jgi:dolichol-phosphate mannosyltransferase
MILDKTVKVVHRPRKNGLIPAILEGIESSQSEYLLIMDADFSHPPKLIPIMMDKLRNSNCDIVIASRYVKGGSVQGWSLKRRLISLGAIKLSQLVLGIRKVKDPTSGFFICKRSLLEGLKIDSTGYKFLLELLVKASHAKIEEIPYAFVDRKAGESKLNHGVIMDYMKSVYRLHRYKRQQLQQQLLKQKESGQRQRKIQSTHIERLRKKYYNSSQFLSKAAKFLAIGASGLFINYFASFMLSNGTLSSIWYLKATLVGIILSLTSNFFLNKVWTFNDRDFSPRHTFKQYAMFVATCSLGIALQLVLVYGLMQTGTEYQVSLILAVVLASISNFLLTKKWTFHEKIWG